MRRSFALLALLLVSCAPSTPAQAPPPSMPPPGYGPPPGYPQAQPPLYAPAPAPSQPTYAPAPAPVPVAAPSRPLLAPLIGSPAWQAEIRSVITEDIAALSPDNQARVRGIPLVVDPNPYEINAYATCDDQGHPSIVGTEGLLEAIDAIAQTRATDELYGTRTYDAYTSSVIPQLAQSDKASAALPLGVVAPNYYSDPRRLSRAHEWFDEIAAFTFGHELSHHYFGHTGCAYGAPAPLGGLAQAFGAAGSRIPLFIQPLETAADTGGTINVLDAGRARSLQGQFRWTEEGGLALLDFFYRLEQGAGPRSIVGQARVAFLNSHPPAAIRMPWVRTAASTWHLQHPG